MSPLKILHFDPTFKTKPKNFLDQISDPLSNLRLLRFLVDHDRPDLIVIQKAKSTNYADFLTKNNYEFFERPSHLPGHYDFLAFDQKMLIREVSYPSSDPFGQRQLSYLCSRRGHKFQITYASLKFPNDPKSGDELESLCRSRLSKVIKEVHGKQKIKHLIIGDLSPLQSKNNHKLSYLLLNWSHLEPTGIYDRLFHQGLELDYQDLKEMIRLELCGHHSILHVYGLKYGHNHDPDFISDRILIDHQIIKLFSQEIHTHSNDSGSRSYRYDQECVIA